MRMQSKAAIKAIPSMVAVYVVVVILEESTAYIQRTNRHPPLGPEVLLSLLALVVGTFLIGTRFAIGSWGFVFGVAGALIFVPRFNHNARFVVGLALKADTDAELYGKITIGIIGLGLACRCAVWLASVLTNPETKP